MGSTMSDYENLKAVLNYDPVSGKFTWIKSKGRGMHFRSGEAGTTHVRGYRYIRFMGRSLFAHRLAWLYMTGAWPTHQIDHIDGVKDNNAWSNLREATNGQNQENLVGAKGKTRTGRLGITFRRGMFEARIQVNGRRRHIGTFTELVAAEAAYADAKRKLHTHTDRFKC